MTAGDPKATSAAAAREREALSWLYRFSDWERGVGWSRDAAPEEVWKLGRTRALLDLAGSPDHRLRIVHVAGTKGKGSTVTYLESIVRAAGWRTGAYTQPHLHAFRERIRLDGRPVDAETFADGVQRLAGLVDQLAALHPDAGAPTTFELTTVLAVLLFEQAGVDVAIVEVGLGGRLDATNALETNLAIVARIGRDHSQILGNTLAEIAAEKVAIARPGQTVLSAVQAPSARDAIRAECAEIDADLREVPLLRMSRAHNASGAVTGRLSSGKTYTTTLGLAVLLERVGEHQRQNAALAVAAADALVAEGLPLTAKAVEAGLRDAWLPARMELVALRPRILIDAAHNVDSARALAAEIRGWRTRPLWLVLGILRDKDATAILRELVPVADGLIVVTPTSPRALPAEALAAACRRAGPLELFVDSSMHSAIETARAFTAPDGAMVIAGSFATATEARAAFGLEDVVTAEAHRIWLRDGGLETE